MTLRWVTGVRNVIGKNTRVMEYNGMQLVLRHNLARKSAQNDTFSQ